MKTYKFKITEYNLIGYSERVVEIKARTLGSAQKKLAKIQGDRCWVVEGQI